MNRANPAFVLQADANPIQAINDFLRSPLLRLGLYFGLVMSLARILDRHRCWPTRDIAVPLGRSGPDLPVLWSPDLRYRGRPSEDLLDSRDRELELTVLEREMRKKVDVCATRRSVVEKDYLLSPECGWDPQPCENCQKPLQAKWSTCPYCGDDARISTW